MKNVSTRTRYYVTSIWKRRLILKDFSITVSSMKAYLFVTLLSLSAWAVDPAIVAVEFRGHTILLHAGRDAPTYSVKKGDWIAKNLSALEIEQKDPDLYRLIKEALIAHSNQKLIIGEPLGERGLRDSPLSERIQ